MKKKTTQRRTACLASIALLMLAGETANAALITIEPDDYAPGTDLSHIVAGVTLESLYQAGNSGNRWNPVVSPIYAGTSYSHAPTGDQMFATQLLPTGYGLGDARYADGCHRITLPSGISGYCNQGFSVLSARFESGTSFVSLDGVWTADPVWLYAYNSAGELVASCFGPNEPNNPGCYTAGLVTPGWNNGTVSVYSAASDIAWIIASSDNGAGGVDRLVFESPASVPEPATFGMLLAGVAGGFIARRKKRAS